MALRVVFMGRKPGASEALRFLVERGVEVAAVVAPEPHRPADGDPPLDKTARELALPAMTAEALAGNAGAFGAVDLVVSYLYWRRIRPPILTLGRLGCINLHPAPLPDYRGLGGYNFAILNGDSEFGVSAHFVDEAIDTGDVIEVRRFGIDPARETAWSLARRSQREMLALFCDVIDRLLRDGTLPRTPQGAGRYITREEMNAAKRVDPNDPPELVERKIRAFWYPPYEGAYVELAGAHYTLVSDTVLQSLIIL